MNLFRHQVLHALYGLCILCAVTACKNNQSPVVEIDIAKTPAELKEKTTNHIKELMDFSAANKGSIGDSITLYYPTLVQNFYEKVSSITVWSKDERFTVPGDSLMDFIAHAKFYGLYPEDYHFNELDSIRKAMEADATMQKDATRWSRADIMLTDAWMHVMKDIKLGRLPNDSITLRKDSIISDTFLLEKLTELQAGGSVTAIANSLEPQHAGYRLIKAGIPRFLDSADQNIYTMVPSSKDTVNFKRSLQKRLYEAGFMASDSIVADSLSLAAGIKKYQKHIGITIDGKAGDGTVRMLNMSDKDRFLKIAISMDRYKLLPEKLPQAYIWVNLPSFAMRVQDGDTVRVVSKIICGKTTTRTPLLTSSISEMITYPQWTIPTSIIVKEVLPAAKRNPGYFEKKGFSLVDAEGNEVDPYTVEWSKYSKGIPYKVVQGSGDANALGVLKFNFPNKYSVYLHDTNQRSLFGVPVRTLSHGCVRVQDWQKLATYIIQRDNPGKTKIPMLDSMNTWLQRKEKHSIPVRNRLPVYIRYFTCEGKPGGLTFYDDIYGEDRRLKERFFAGK
jgi:murein L,D-transpeptidase YcbB/YkuD